MFRSLFLTTALVGITGVTMIQNAHANGSYPSAGGSIALDAQPMLGSVYQSAAPAYQQAGQTYETLGGQYEVIDQGAGAATYTDGTYLDQGYAAPVQAPVHNQSTSQTYTIEAGSSQTYTVPAGQDATYNIVVPSAAPAVTYAQPPVYAAPQATGAGGWAARGVYIGARGGVSSNRDTKFSIAAPKNHPSNRVRSSYDDPGYTGALVVGYGVRQKHGWGYRVELEGGYQSASVDQHTIDGDRFSSKQSKGDVKTLYGFVNAYGDLPVSERLSLTAGGGVGVGKVKFDDYGVKGLGPALNDSATAFGYHLDAGVTYQVSDKVALEALYRYQSFVDAEVKTINGNSQKIDVDSHSILAGMRVGF